MPKKTFLISSIILTVLFLGVFWYTALPAAHTFCGDYTIQSPNNEGGYEKCDDGPEGSIKCTGTCGEKMLGWAWSLNIGWVSLNQQNCALLPTGTCTNTFDYFTSIDADNQIRGWAWSENAGWICFGQTCALANICNSQTGCNPADFGSEIPTIRGVAGWEARIEQAEAEVPKVLGWGKILALKDDGWISLSCENINNCAISPYQVLMTKSTFTFDQQVEKRFSFNGWAWNGSTIDYSAGWIAFSPAPSTNPWLQTQAGDVYAQKGIQGTPAPATAYNATYRILSNQAITGFSSAQAESLWIEPGYGQINFPTVQTRYSNALGSLDVDGLICNFGKEKTCINKYGVTVVDGAPAYSSAPLGAKIYYIKSNLTINPNISFKNATGYESGAGTIFVNGDLTIRNEIIYEASAAETRFKNLAAVAWIIKGDLKIKGSVNNLVGNFIVLGNGTECSESALGPDGCGQVFSCYDGSCNTAPLTISGFVMARKFNFSRTYTAPPPAVQPAERVIYDGRLLANTPPGLVDFAKAMPLWRSDVVGQ